MGATKVGRTLALLSDGRGIGGMGTVVGELREESKEGVEAELALKIIVLETFAQRDKIWIGMMKEELWSCWVYFDQEEEVVKRLQNSS